jgi:hypothetical protein
MSLSSHDQAALIQGIGTLTTVMQWPDNQNHINREQIAEDSVREQAGQHE